MFRPDLNAQVKIEIFASKIHSIKRGLSCLFNILKIVCHLNALVTVRMTNDYTVWERGNGGSALPLTIDVTVNYPVQTVSYHPGFWQVSF